MQKQLLASRWASPLQIQVSRKKKGEVANVYAQK